MSIPAIRRSVGVGRARLGLAGWVGGNENGCLAGSPRPSVGAALFAGRQDDDFPDAEYAVGQAG